MWTLCAKPRTTGQGDWAQIRAVPVMIVPWLLWGGQAYCRGAKARGLLVWNREVDKIFTEGLESPQYAAADSGVCFCRSLCYGSGDKLHWDCECHPLRD